MRIRKIQIKVKTIFYAISSKQIHALVHYSLRYQILQHQMIQNQEARKEQTHLQYHLMNRIILIILRRQLHRLQFDQTRQRRHCNSAIRSHRRQYEEK